MTQILDKVWSRFTYWCAEVLPSGDPHDWVLDEFQSKYKISKEKTMEYLTAAARKNGYQDSWEFVDEFMSDSGLGDEGVQLEDMDESLKGAAKIGAFVTGIAGLGAGGAYLDDRQPKVDIGGQKAFLIQNPSWGKIPKTARTLRGDDGNTYVVWSRKGPGGHNWYATPAENVNEGYRVLPGIDREKYQERAGLEGPFRARNGKVYYYDPKVGMAYDPDTDFYIEYDDFVSMDKDPDLVSESEKHKQSRIWAMISDYEKKAKDAKDNIKKAHYMKMADDLRLKLKTNIDEAIRPKHLIGGLALVAALMGVDNLTSAKNTPLGKALAVAAQQGDQDAAKHLEKLDFYTDSKQSALLTQLSKKYVLGRGHAELYENTPESLKYSKADLSKVPTDWLTHAVAIMKRRQDPRSQQAARRGEAELNKRRAAQPKESSIMKGIQR